MSNNIKQSTWPGWETVRLIGRGSFGTVYEIQRNVFDDTEKAALKVISLPQNEGEIEELYNDGYDEESVTSTFQSHLQSIVKEYTLMRQMNGCTNIVNCDDVRYVQHEDGIGWDIFIKMELLMPLSKVLPKEVSDQFVVNVGVDMCAALKLCKKHGIIHRDIKPQNIFVSPNGDYKLGDFGVAKTVEKTIGGTKIGTYKYMAPEVYNNQPYGSAADIYSLGLVLYWMLNDRRMPFAPAYPEKMTAEKDAEARNRRLDGEPLPPPAHGSEELKRIVLKACAYNPKDRYGSAEEMLSDLNQLHSEIYDGEDTVKASPDEEKTIIPSSKDENTVVSTPKESDETLAETVLDRATPHKADHTKQQGKNVPQKSEKLPIVICIASVIVLLLLLIRGYGNGGILPSTTDPGDVLEMEALILPEESFELYAGETAVLQVEGGDGAYRFESSDEHIVTISENGEMNAVGAGTATITVISGGAEATATVTIQDYKMSFASDELSLFADATASLEILGIPENAQIHWSSDHADVATVKDGVVTALRSGTARITATWENGARTYTATATVTVAASGVTLSTNSIETIYVGETQTITAETAPAGQTVTWTSSDSSIVTVNDGEITAVGAGSATITATAGNYSESCTVTVVAPSVSLDNSSISLYVGDSSSLCASAVPGDASVSWSSDNTGVATVSNGQVTAVGAGNATITAKINHAGKDYAAACNVTVASPGISLSATSYSLMPGGSVTLSATVKPSGRNVSWSSSNTGVATVSNGKVTAVAVGSATITAQITYGDKSYKATCSITVSNPTITVTSSASTITYAEREQDRGTCTLTANVNPDGGSISWQSSDTAVASVSGNGKTATVKAVSSGTATITASYSIGGKTVTSSCTILVQKAASSLRIDNLWCPEGGTCDSFRIQGTVTSNYSLVRFECTGTATSNALGITLSDTADPLYVSGGVYSYDLADATSYFINQYRKLYELYEAAAGLLGADNSVTMNITGTAYDSSGTSKTFTFKYVIYGE